MSSEIIRSLHAVVPSVLAALIVGCGTLHTGPFGARATPTFEMLTEVSPEASNTTVESTTADSSVPEEGTVPARIFLTDHNSWANGNTTHTIPTINESLISFTTSPGSSPAKRLRLDVGCEHQSSN